MMNLNAQSKIDDLVYYMHAESGIDLPSHAKHILFNADLIPRMLFVIVWGSDCPR